MTTPLKVVTLLAIAGLATAYSYHVSWLAPTARPDGSPLLVTDIASYRIEWGWCAVGSAVQSQVAPGPALEYGRRRQQAASNRRLLRDS